MTTTTPEPVDQQPTRRPGQPATSAGRPAGLPVRRLDLDLASSDIERWLVRDDPIFSHFVATLSAMFPNGEDFFVDSVRAYRLRFADDPAMKAKVKGFIGQESVHGREHRILNDRLTEMGYPTDWTDAALQRAADRNRKLPASLQIAITAASEHLTGIFAEAVLGHEGTRETLFPDADLQIMLSWHALEELEHKDVAFDVMMSVNRSYLLRVAGMVAIVPTWVPVLVGGMARGLWRDRAHLGRQALVNLRRDLRRQRMLSPWALRRLGQYFRPGFHPNDMGTDELVVEWRTRLTPHFVTRAA